MASSYEHGINPFQDFLIELLLNNLNISDKTLKRDINTTFVYLLENTLNNPKDAINLEFQIIKNRDWFKVKGMNLISALWLSGLAYDDVHEALQSKYFDIDGKKYKYNKKNNELILIDNE